MSTPIIIVAGKAGSGKDTVAGYIAEEFNGVCIAQADPMKRFVRRAFGFTEHQLWGPSEARNASVPLADLQIGDFGRAAECLALDVFGGVLDARSSYGRSLAEWRTNHIQKRLDENGEISARVVLQTLGTEWGRKFAPTMWIDRAILNARKLVEGGFTYTREEGMVPSERAFDYAIITDGRFRNEMLGVTFLGGVALRVKRPSKDLVAVGIAGHASEKELDSIPEHFYTGTIMNDSTFETLYSRVDDEMAILFGDSRAR